MPIVRGAARRAVAAALGWAVAAAFACFASLACFAGVAAAAESGAEAAQYQLETDLTCQCGCGLTVHSCNHLNCGSAIPLKKEIAEQIATGRDRGEILTYFEEKYGEKILSSPTTRGFNLAAWTVPFIALAIGGAIVGVVLSRWRRATTERTAPAATAPSPMDPDLRARLDSELRDFDRRS